MRRNKTREETENGDDTYEGLREEDVGVYTTSNKNRESDSQNQQNFRIGDNSQDDFTKENRGVHPSSALHIPPLRLYDYVSRYKKQELDALLELPGGIPRQKRASRVGWDIEIMPPGNFSLDPVRPKRRGISYGSMQISSRLYNIEEDVSNRSAIAEGRKLVFELSEELSNKLNITEGKDSLSGLTKESNLPKEDRHIHKLGTRMPTTIGSELYRKENGYSEPTGIQSHDSKQVMISPETRDAKKERLPTKEIIISERATELPFFDRHVIELQRPFAVQKASFYLNSRTEVSKIRSGQEKPCRFSHKPSVLGKGISSGGVKSKVRHHSYASNSRKGSGVPMRRSDLGESPSSSEDEMYYRRPGTPETSPGRGSQRREDDHNSQSLSEGKGKEVLRGVEEEKPLEAFGDAKKVTASTPPCIDLSRKSRGDQFQTGFKKDKNKVTTHIYMKTGYLPVQEYPSLVSGKIEPQGSTKCDDCRFDGSMYPGPRKLPETSTIPILQNESDLPNLEVAGSESNENHGDDIYDTGGVQESLCIPQMMETPYFDSIASNFETESDFTSFLEPREVATIGRVPAEICFSLDAHRLSPGNGVMDPWAAEHEPNPVIFSHLRDHAHVGGNDYSRMGSLTAAEVPASKHDQEMEFYYPSAGNTSMIQKKRIDLGPNLLLATGIDCVGTDRAKDSYHDSELTQKSSLGTDSPAKSTQEAFQSSSGSSIELKPEPPAPTESLITESPTPTAPQGLPEIFLCDACNDIYFSKQSFRQVSIPRSIFGNKILILPASTSR